MSEKFKKALRMAVNVGCGFEGDAEDAVSLLGLIEANEARIAELNEALRIRLVANDELPEAKESVLALVKEKWSGELYIERACYIPPKSIRADDFFLDDLEDESVEEYDEELDLYWVAEGWWEDSHEANVNWKITGEVIGWWSLPKIEVEGCYTESTTMG